MIFYDLIDNSYLNLFVGITNLIALVFTIWIFVYIYYVVIKKQNWIIKKIILLPVIIFSIIGYIDIIHYYFFKDTNLNSRYQKEEYHKHYYAYIYESKNDVKCYKLPVKIYTYKQDFETSNGFTGYKRVYYIEYVYWINGGYLKFSDQEIIPFKKTEIEDVNDKKWYVELINEECHKYSDEYIPNQELIENIKNSSTLSPEEKESVLKVNEKLNNSSKLFP